VWSIPHHLDPPEHGKYRPIVLDLFSPRVLAPLSESIREVARNLVDGFAVRGNCDFVNDFAMRMPIEIFMRMAGLPEARREELLDWVKTYFHGATAEASLAAHRQSVAFLGEWLDQQLREQTSTQGHIVPALAKAATANGPLTRDEMLSIAISLFNGGLDTVAAQMTHVMRFLAEHPAPRQQLIDDPGLIPDAVEELLRRFSIISIGRSVTRDAEFAGVQLHAGDMVLCLLGAAGLDEAAFGNALDVDFKRGNRRQHCAFGSGPHMCPGAPLARLELKILLEELLPRLPNLRIRQDARLGYHTGVTLGLVTLPLEWDAARTMPAK
jgi:cytochrome P450